MNQNHETTWLPRGLMVAAAIILGLSLLGLALPAHAQGGADYWAEVNIGGPRTVFVPAECVTGISFERQAPGAEVDVTATNVGTFQRADIVCDTPLYDLPGGSVIEGETLHQGSSWMVSPVLWPSLSRAALQGETDEPAAETAPAAPRADTTASRVTALGQRWVEVMITPGTPRVYAPAECIAGVPFSHTLTWTTSRSASIAQAEEALADDDELDFGDLWLATIVCNTGLYTTPGGTQIQGEALTTGQFWFVSPYLWSVGPQSTLQSAGAMSATGAADTTNGTGS